MYNVGSFQNSSKLDPRKNAHFLDSENIEGMEPLLLLNSFNFFDHFHNFTLNAGPGEILVLHTCHHNSAEMICIYKWHCLYIEAKQKCLVFCVQP